MEFPAPIEERSLATWLREPARICACTTLQAFHAFGVVRVVANVGSCV